MRQSANIKYPIAIEKSTLKLVNACDVSSGLVCNCFCTFCKEDLIGIPGGEDKKQRPHFRHSPNTNCSAHYETYLHWLAKEIFYSISEIKLPAITKLIFDSRDTAFEKAFENLYKKFNLPYSKSFHEPEITFQDATTLQIKTLLTEKEMKTKIGDIRPDIIIKDGENELLIEPHCTHPVDDEKIEKIKLLNKSAITIDLTSFAMKNEYIFKLEDFKDFLQNDLNSKKWLFIRSSKQDKLRVKILNSIENKFRTKYHLIEKYHFTNSKILENEKLISIKEREISKIYFEQKIISKCNLKLHKEINKLKQAIGF